MNGLESKAGALGEARTGPGRLLFDGRRWIIPPFVITALVLGGAAPAGWLAGGLLLAVALSLHLWACRHIGGASRVHARKALKRRPLIISGPYAWLRNPIYLGNVLGATGACLLTGPGWFAVPSALCVWWLYDRVAAWEEALLSSLHGPAYEAYRDAVPRWLPRPPRTPTALAQPLSPWGKVLRRERGTLIIVACALLLALARGQLG
jgi:protein-S-isoprenylcysteine O-methyltransferase Ste14